VIDPEELHLLAGAYALDALTGPEKDRFEEYLRTSEEARAEVASLSDAAVAIGLAITPVDPPPVLKARLMDQIAHTPQLAPLETPRVIPNVGTPRKESNESAPVGRPVSASPAAARAAARWYTRPAAVLAAAAAAVAIFIGGTIVGLAGARQVEQQASDLTQIYAAPDSQQGKASVAGGGKATFVWSAQLGRSAVVITQLPKLGQGKTYELWYIDTRSNATPAGIFDAASSGTTVELLDGTMTAGDTLGITVEPAGGSEKPTSAPIVAVPSA
jgi:anti-sigma-K factor RskA